MKYLYRIVNVLLALLMFPVVIFSDLIAFRMSTSLIDQVGLEESFSIKFIIDILTGKEAFWHQMLIENTEGGFSWPADLDIIKGRLITFAVCFVLVLVAMIFIIVWSCCSNKRIPILAASVFSLISTRNYSGTARKKPSRISTWLFSGGPSGFRTPDQPVMSRMR